MESRLPGNCWINKTSGTKLMEILLPLPHCLENNEAPRVSLAHI